MRSTAKHWSLKRLTTLDLKDRQDSHTDHTAVIWAGYIENAVPQHPHWLHKVKCCLDINIWSLSYCCVLLSLDMEISASIFRTRPSVEVPHVMIDMIGLDKSSTLARVGKLYFPPFFKHTSDINWSNLSPPHHYWYNLCEGKNKINLLICVGRQSGSTVFAPGNDLKHKRRPSVKPSTWQHMKNRQISVKVSSLSPLPASARKGLKLMMRNKKKPVRGWAAEEVTEEACLRCCYHQCVDQQ